MYKNNDKSVTTLKQTNQAQQNTTHKTIITAPLLTFPKAQSLGD